MLTRKLTHLEAHAIAHRLHQAEEIVAGVVEELARMEDSPHGQDDGACGWCYDEATSGEKGEARGVCQRCGGTGVVDDGEITGAGGVEFENGLVKCVKDCPDCADSTPAKAEAKCKACGGNDGDMPCAYPEGRADCLHNASVATLDDSCTHNYLKGVCTKCGEEWWKINHRPARLLPQPQAAEPTLGEQFEYLDVQNSNLRRAMQKIMARLTELLDEDQFGNIASIVREAGVMPPNDSAQAAEPKGLTDEQIESLAYRHAYRYRHGPDSIENIFNRNCLLNFARALLAKGE